ncbi:MAG: hypothetical protein FWH20_04605 [Oscillospiraceae bacterium]|nr:hypothetical protein [Oscillospiraceae bacterium]
MLAMNATDVRNDWSAVLDSVIREKPKFIKRTRDYMLLSGLDIIEIMLEAYKFTADEYIEDDGSVTLSLVEMDLVDNGKTKEEAIHNLAKDILEYAADYYQLFFDDWSVSTNRRAHLPFVFKALILNDIEKIGELIQCRPGEI